MQVLKRYGLKIFGSDSNISKPARLPSPSTAAVASSGITDAHPRPNIRWLSWSGLWWISVSTLGAAPAWWRHADLRQVKTLTGKTINPVMRWAYNIHQINQDCHHAGAQTPFIDAMNLL